MKLVSPKNLLVSLLGCAFVVLKIVTFDGIADLFWILFIGYLSVKCLAAGLSQEAYDKDIKQAQQAKVLYRDLFGKFAYVAADIPILLLLFTGLLAVICPITAFLRAVLITLLLAAAGYAVWLCWYVSKHKRQRIFKGEWGTGVLSPEEEKAWKRSACGTAFSWGSLRYFVLFISFLEIHGFHESIRYKTEKRYLRRMVRTAPGEECFLLLLMQNWPGRRSVFRSTEKKRYLSGSL